MCKKYLQYIHQWVKVTFKQNEEEEEGVEFKYLMDDRGQIC